jgi:hypothetical protein
MSADDASATSWVVKPSAIAASRDGSLRTHTRTATPLSRRFSAHDRPWLP